MYKTATRSVALVVVVVSLLLLLSGCGGGGSTALGIAGGAGAGKPQVLKIFDVEPEVGLPGATVRVEGNGFASDVEGDLKVWFSYVRRENGQNNTYRVEATVSRVVDDGNLDVVVPTPPQGHIPDTGIGLDCSVVPEDTDRGDGTAWPGFTVLRP